MYRIILIIMFIVFHLSFFGTLRPEVHGIVPCMTDNDCDEYYNATCVMPFCVCNGTKNCKETVKRVVTKLGKECTKSEDCNIDFAICKTGQCLCQSGYINSTNGRKCLAVSKRLGDVCEDTAQCNNTINYSVCVNKKCVCESTHEVNGSCYKSIELGGICHTDSECLANKFAICKSSTCTCSDGYVGALQNSLCASVAEELKSPCIDDVQCTATLGDFSHCTESVCKCKELYHYKKNMNKCVQDKLYGEICVIHSDCHDPDPDKEKRLECIYGECKCRSFFKTINGICIDSHSSKLAASSYLLILSHVIRKFLHYSS